MPLRMRSVHPIAVRWCNRLVMVVAYVLREKILYPSLMRPLVVSLLYCIVQLLCT